MGPYVNTMTAHVNERGIVLRFNPVNTLAPHEWEALLDGLRSHYIPSFYQYGKRMHVDVDAQGQMRAVVYFTPQTVNLDEAIAILKRWNIEVIDVRRNAADV